MKRRNTHTHIHTHSFVRCVELNSGDIVNSVNQDAVEMRASAITFIFILSEISIISRTQENCKDPPEIENAEKVNNVTSRFRMQCNKGYKRKAGTSNLFKCEKNQWKNEPPLKCILLDSLMQNVSPTSFISTKTPDIDKHPGDVISTATGTVSFTTTHKAPTTVQSFHNTSRGSTTMKEMSVTTSATASSTTEREKQTTLSIPSSSSSSINKGNFQETTNTTYEMFTARGGIVIVVILGVAATVAFLYWRRRSQRHRADGLSVEMPIQNPVTPFTDTLASTYSDAPFSA